MKNYLAAFCAISCSLAACQPKTSESPNPHTGDSHRISLDSANRMISSYLGSLDSSAPIADLRSVVFDAAQLRKYLSDTAITQVKISLAHKLQYINAGNQNVMGGYRSDAITLIISAVDHSGNYIFPGNQVMDYAMQCPVLCPVGTAASALFPIPTSPSNEQ